MNTRITMGLLGSALLLAAPAMAASLASTAPAQPIPQFDFHGPDRQAIGDGDAPVTADASASGRAALVPVLVDTPAGSQRSRAGHDAAAGAPDPDAAGGDRSVDDLSFVQQAAENGHRELSAARDALPRLQNPELKRIASLLVNDHGSTNAQLARLAESRGWPLPAPESATPRDPAAGTAGDDFDELWTADMISRHERSAALYRAQAQGGEDAELRRFARDTLPTIEHHLEELRRRQ